MTFDRLLSGDEDGSKRARPAADADAMREEWLDYLTLEREQLIRRLRHVDNVLIKHGRLRHLTLPPRIR